MTAILAMYRMLFRQLFGTSRFVLAGGFTLLGLLLAVVIRRDSGDADLVDNTVGLITVLGLNLMVPVIALVLGASVLGNLVEDETLVYLWHRPSERWKLAAAAWAAAVSLALPLTALPLAITSLVGSSDGATVGGTALASMLSSVAYCGVFALLGLVVKRALIWGLLYLFVWEAVISNFAEGAARLSINTYATSVLAQVADVEIDLATRGTIPAILVPIAVAMVSIALSTWRLESMDVA